MTEHTPNCRYLMDKLSYRVMAFLNKELSIETTSISFAINTIQKMELNYLTSLINVEGDVKMFVVLSYDESLFNEVFVRYTRDLVIEKEEQEEAIIDSAGDVINIIVGNTLADINEANKKIIISPPIIITAAKQIACQRHALFYKATLVTEYGGLDVYLLKNLIEH
jgi:CheY-specific phosphatase CheX